MCFFSIMIILIFHCFIPSFMTVFLCLLCCSNEYLPTVLIQNLILSMITSYLILLYTTQFLLECVLYFHISFFYIRHNFYLNVFLYFHISFLYVRNYFYLNVFYNFIFHYFTYDIVYT